MMSLSVHPDVRCHQFHQFLSVDVIDKDAKETPDKDKVTETEGKDGDTGGKVAETDGKDDDTEGKVAETDGKETADDTPLVDGSELPFNPQQSGPKENHVAVESKGKQK